MNIRQRVTTARVLPDNGNNNGWYNLLPPPPPARRLGPRETAHWAIIGAGCCGLAVARQLAEHRPQDRIVLIDAERAGFGASGRNSGFMLNVHTHGTAKDLDVVRRNMRLWQGGLEDLRRLVTKHQIQCDWSDWGRLYGAAGPEGESHMTEVAESYDRLELTYEWLDNAAMKGATGTPFYTMGIRAQGSALVQPAALMRGLAETLPANVDVYENCPVHEIAKGRGFELVCGAETLRAEKLILASGVFITDLDHFRNRIVPVATYASLTRPLTATEREPFQDIDEFALLPTSPNGSTIRLMRDGRILMRNGFTYEADKRFEPGDLDNARGLHREAMSRRWPALADIEFVDTWGGIMAFTRNDGAIFGKLDENIYGVVSSDISPVTRGSMAGKLLADYVVGADSELLRLQLDIPKAGLLPPDPLLRFAVNFQFRRIRKSGAAEM
jgi:glycine/D-amino acid oxidase-like deaminating enzyme